MHMADETSRDLASDDEYVEAQQTGEGYVFGETFGAKPVGYAIVDGQAVFEGDIILGAVEEMEAGRRLGGMCFQHRHPLPA
jgi:hypothetical protein